MNELTEEKLKELETAYRCSSSGQWMVEKTKFHHLKSDKKNYVVVHDGALSIFKVTGSEGMEPEDCQDAVFVSLAHRLVPALISAARERERLRELVKLSFREGFLYGWADCADTPRGSGVDAAWEDSTSKLRLGTPKELHPPASGMETLKD